MRSREGELTGSHQGAPGRQSQFLVILHSWLLARKSSSRLRMSFQDELMIKKEGAKKSRQTRFGVKLSAFKCFF